MTDRISGGAFKQMVAFGAACIAQQKQTINDLNVFPVPDGDTGTNMCLTIQTAVNELRKNQPATVEEAAKITASGLLRGARGNSGVILSLLFRGMSKALKGVAEADGAQLAAAMQEGVATAYGAVMKPAEGTVLTVSRCASEAAVERSKAGVTDIEELLADALAVARETLAKTVDMNPVLKKAGVVDAGGQGIMLVFEGMKQVFDGGEIIAAGTVDDIIAAPRSITGQYLSGAKKIPLPETRREGNGKSLKIFGAAENNLRHIDVEFPLGTFTCVTGVSGSGKSSLVNEILYKKLAGSLNRARTRPGKFDRIEGLEHLDKVVGIDQSPIGRMPSSNPATYTGVFNDIRDLFASTADARTRGYGPGRFSFNTKGGRCEACSGNGLVKIEMHFLADVFVPCEVCRGKRYNRETLEVLYKGKNIADILDMTAEEALAFFDNLPRIRNKIATLVDVGLGYIKLGQSATTLSGGEAQRVKLATELSRRATGRTFYILDEPTTGLHMADVHKLIEVLQRLVDAGNTVLVIEHNLDVIKVADYIVDLGPEGGSGGGQIVACGTPEQIAACPESFTGQYLKKLLK